MKQKITFALIMGIITTAIISFTVVSVNLGFTEKFMEIWMRSWGLAYMVVVPCILIIAPVVEKLVKKLLTTEVEIR